MGNCTLSEFYDCDLSAVASAKEEAIFGVRNPCFALDFVGGRIKNSFNVKQSGTGAPQSKVRPKSLTKI